MALEKVEVGCTYEMSDGRKLRVIHELDAPGDHARVRFEVIEGDQSGFLDMSRKEFLLLAVRKLN